MHMEVNEWIKVVQENNLEEGVVVHGQ